MSLRSKLTLILGCVIALYGVIHFVVLQTVVFPSFEQLEKQQARKDLGRVVAAIQNEIKHLDTVCHDWATWDETWQFVQDANEKYSEDNLQDSALENLDVHLMYFVRTDGTVIRRVLREPESGVDPLDLPEFPEDRHPLEDPLRCVSDLDASITGVLMTKSGPMLVSSRPIQTTKVKGTIVGYLVLGRMLDGEAVLKLNRQAGVDFRIWPLEQPDALPENLGAGWEEVRLGAEDSIRVRDSGILEAFAPVLDMKGRPVVLVEAAIPRSTMSEGRRAIDFAMWSTVIAGVLILCVLTWLLQRVVVRPLAHVTAHTVSIGRDDDPAARLSSTRGDEIGVLSREIDAMCDDLALSQLERIESAREAGMSEVATEVLHSVGNVLNSVNVSAGVIRNSLKRMKLEDLERISKGIEVHAGDLATFVKEEGKGRQLLEYLAVLSGHLEEERQAMIRESASLSDGLDHILELVRAQQDLAGRSGDTDTVFLASEIETAIRISDATAEGRIEVARAFADLPRIRVYKPKLLQILVNLLKNARESVEEAGVQLPRIEVRARPSPDGSRILVEVTDNGVGIARERLVSVFAHGRTSKKNGHGFGLHTSANAAGEMGGSITVESAGPGLGATFTLTMPFEREALAA